MTTKTDETTVDVTAGDEDIEIGGFTPEEEAALDAAARSGDIKADAGTAAVDKKADKVAEAVSPEEELKRLRKELDDANAVIKRSNDERKADEAKIVDRVSAAERAEEEKILLADKKAEADLELAERDVKDLNRQLREAKENGDLDKEIDINDKLLDAKIKTKQIKDAKEGFDKWKGSRKDYWEVERKKAEKRVATSSSEIPFNADDFTPKALSWIDKHPEFKTDKAFNEKAIRAHYAARGEGIAEDTDEYFAFLDKRLGFADDTADADAAAEAAAKSDAGVTIPTKKPVTKVQTTPPSRTATGQVRQEGSRIKKLSPAEVEAADISGMTPEEYWDEKYGNQKG